MRIALEMNYTHLIFADEKRKFNSPFPLNYSLVPIRQLPANLENLLQDFFVSVIENAVASPTSFLGRQKLEVMFAQGHLICPRPDCVNLSSVASLEVF